MRKFFLVALSLFALCATGIAQPLPCPPLSTTLIDATGDTTICPGSCATLSEVSSTTIQSTSSYSFSTIPYLPTSFSGGTPILVGIDDVYSSALPLPFAFCFYGTKYNSCLIGANGEICFSTALAGAYCPWSIPGPIPTAAGSLNDATKNTIMGAYYDMDPSIPGGGNINWAIYGTAPCRTFVVSWNNIPLYNAGTCPGLKGTQQIVLYESTYAIDIFVHVKPACTAWNSGFGSIGIVDATGANYMFAPGKNATSFAIADSGYRFTPNGSASWAYTWYDTHTGAVVGSTATVTVCPTDSNTYIVKGVASSNCDSFTVYSSAFVGMGGEPSISSITHSNPTSCGANDGQIVLHGLVPGLSDTIYYKFNGVLQPYVVQVSAIDSTLKLLNLCAGVYDSIVVKVGYCVTPPYGPIILTAPGITIGTGIITHPSICGACDGSLTITGLLPSQAYTLNYSKDGVPITITITTTAAGTYTITDLCAGIYSSISATATLGPCASVCTTPVIGPFVLIAPPPFTISVIAFTNPSDCGHFDGTITLRAVTPFSSDTVTYDKDGIPQTAIVTTALSDSTIHITGLGKGTYTNFSVKIGPCISPGTGSATLDWILPVARFDTSVHFGCNGDTVNFTNSSTSGGILYYIWNFGDGASDTAMNPHHIFQQGTYTVTLIATNHYCFDSTKIPLNLVHPLKAGFTADPVLLCQGSPVTFTDTSITNGAGVGHAWTFGDGGTDTVKNPVYNFQKTGTFNVQMVITDWVPCKDTANITIDVDTTSGIAILTTDSVLCAGQYITLTGLYASRGNTGISWTFSNGDSILAVNPLVKAFNTAGTYTVYATPHYRACKDTTGSRVIHVMQQPTISLGPDTSICAGSETITLRDDINSLNTAASWHWSTGSRGPSTIIVAPGIYFATVNINNCYSSDTITVNPDCYMDIPNVFSPNGDGINDYFYPRSLLTRGLTHFTMNIYNRWGQLIFETTSLDGAGWDGKMNGVRQPQGVYVYVIDATFRDGQKEHHQGNVTLMR